MGKHESPKAESPTGGMAIGRKRFAAISAVEGIKLTPEMERRAAELNRKGLTPEDASARSWPHIARGKPADMYEAEQDPYCYPGTSVLINRLDIRDQAALDAFETDATAERSSHEMPQGSLDFGTP